MRVWLVFVMMVALLLAGLAAGAQADYSDSEEPRRGGDRRRKSCSQAIQRRVRMIQHLAIQSAIPLWAGRSNCVVAQTSEYECYAKTQCECSIPV